MLAPRRPLLLAALLAFAAVAALAHANHFILPCDDVCTTSRWVATGPMTRARWMHTATLLPNGKVLVAGGRLQDGNKTDSAELYDPSTGPWSATGRMTFARESHTATLLGSGKVLVTGDASTSAELYDPGTGTWAATGSMVEARGSHGAALLADGRVLVAGGWHVGPGAVVNRSAEIYDPATEKWTRTGDLIIGRWGATLTTLPDGQALAVMGTDSDDFMTSVATAERYDPATGTWSRAGDTGFRGAWHTASPLPNGRVLVVGGYDGSGGNRSTALFDPLTSTWWRSGDLVDRSFWHTAAVLSGGDLIVAGGEMHTPWPPAVQVTAHRTVHRFDPATATWSLTAPLIAARAAATLTALPDGTALVAGGVFVENVGETYSQTVRASSERYIPAAASSTARGPCLLGGCDGDDGSGLQGPRAIEYYHPALDRYFLSASPAELDALDAHRVDGWARTGSSFPVALSADSSQGLTDPVCRFYLPPEAGDSHFFSASPAECAEVAARFPSFVREADAAFYVALPDALSGACADPTLRPVYRVWNGRAAANHRYTTVRTVRDRMIARGYVPEGYGPDGVAFCVP